MTNLYIEHDRPTSEADYSVHLPFNRFESYLLFGS